MKPEDAETIRSLPWTKGPSAERAIEIVDLWNQGYSSHHIAELLDLEAGVSLVLSVLAAIRGRTDLWLRKVVQRNNRALTLEHPTWWTLARVETMRKLWEPGDLKTRAIGVRMGTSEDNISSKIAELGWRRAPLSGSKARGRGGVTRSQMALANAAAAHKPVVWEALEGTEPKPFWKVALTGECNWILGDQRGSMADALCCAAETEPCQRYCEEHRKAGLNPRAWGEPKSAKQLVREFSRYA